MAEESDGIGEHFDQSLRVALTVASQFGERVSRLREQWSRVREERALREARELTLRFESERAAARAQLAVVEQTAWWEQAQPHAIADVYETAVVWRDYDEVAYVAVDTIRDEVLSRYGIDVDAHHEADPAAVELALREAETDRAEALRQSQLADEELTAAQLLLMQADALERDAQEWADRDVETHPLDASEQVHWDAFQAYSSDLARASEDADAAAFARANADFGYDSAERRQAFAWSLEGRADSAAIAARMMADPDQAHHPREAVAGTSRAAKARRTTKAPVLQKQREELQR